MKNKPIKHDKSHPPAASAGGNNAYYLRGCDEVQRSPSYASCLHRIAEIQAGRESDHNRDCVTAVRRTTCIALGMKEEEALKGIALFFSPRDQIEMTPGGVREHAPVYMPAKKSRPAGTVKPEQKKSALDRELNANDGYAAAINAAMSDLPAEPKTAPPVPQNAPTARPPMQAGESPMQYARRVAALTN